MKLLRRLPEIVLASLAGLLAVLFVPTVYARVLADSHERICREHLSAIYQAIEKYRADHKGDYPASLATPPAVFGSRVKAAALVPRYLKDPSLLICPLDPTGGAKLGWTQPFSYNYGLEELRSPIKEVRKRVKSGLIDRFGPKTYLVICPSLHRNGPVGFLTLHADGRIYKELITVNDPQHTFRQSLWKLERAAPKPK